SGKISGSDRDLATQIQRAPDQVRERLHAFICSWISLQHVNSLGALATKMGGAFPSATTPETVILFLCDYADYRARNFMPAPHEISDEHLSRVFLLAAQEKRRRARARDAWAE
ncbi:MAG: hypothetical protein FWF96_03500, partial [Kiritimatiellaeota bacterium]|nr:hypothetical protein [Kiritimatiellota bacterium]